MIDPDRSHPT